MTALQTQFHVITFSEAVELKLLCDYKVLVLNLNGAARTNSTVAIFQIKVIGEIGSGSNVLHVAAA